MDETYNPTRTQQEKDFWQYGPQTVIVPMPVPKVKKAPVSITITPNTPVIRIEDFN